MKKQSLLPETIRQEIDIPNTFLLGSKYCVFMIPLRLWKIGSRMSDHSRVSAYSPNCHVNSKEGWIMVFDILRIFSWDVNNLWKGYAGRISYLVVGIGDHSDHSDSPIRWIQSIPKFIICRGEYEQFNLNQQGNLKLKANYSLLTDLNHLVRSVMSYITARYVIRFSRRHNGLLYPWL